AAAIIKKHSLPAEDVIAVSDVLDDFGLDYMIHRPVPDTEHFIYRYCSGQNRDFRNRLTLYRKFASTLTPERLARFGEATELLCIVAREKGDRIFTRLSNMFHRQSVIKATSPLDNQSIWIEIFAPGVSKSSAVRWLSRKMDVPRSRTCAVGNDYNDEDLLGWAGEGYMVANGPSSLHSRYTVVASNNEGGVAAAAGRWLGREIS
ncbi:MAG: HAD family phosphatase, partial [Deltaproteobacteria bacterium]|nr:HAD family phosphatase [Deltaproteobacteria bacterium]